MSLSRFVRIVCQRLRAVSGHTALDVALDRELAFHLEQLTAEYIADGMPPDEARHAAKRAIGNMPLIAEQCRDERRTSWLHDLRHDVGYGLRMLVRYPTATCVIVASLALGIGANTAVVGAMDAILRTPLPFPDSDRVFALRGAHQATAVEAPPTVFDYIAWHDQNQSFESMALTLGNQAGFAEENGTPAERIQGVAATANLFDVLRVTPALGRPYTDEEAARESPRVPMVLSHRLWQRRFAGAQDVVGSRVRMNQREAYVVGVMPEGFHYPNGGVDYWIPLAVNRGDAQSPQRVYGITGRLRPGVTAAQAGADLDRISSSLARERPDRHEGWSASIRPVREAMYGWTSEPLWTLEAAVALVLLVACTNVAGLLLARALTRRSEMALRAALGASRGRLVRQLITETTVLAAAGGTLGIVVAALAMRWFPALAPPPGGMPMIDVGVNARMLVVALSISVASALMFGLIPALAGSRWGISESRKGRWREALVIGQIAITLVLLVGAGLLTRSFLAIVTSDVRFNADRLLTFQMNLALGEFMQRDGAAGDRPNFTISATPSQVFQRVHERLLAVPGALGVAGSSVHIVNEIIIPTTSLQTDSASAGDRGPSSGETRDTISSACFIVTPDFLGTIGARMIRGRDLAALDTRSSPWVAVVNETAARMLWPGVDPIGRQVTLSDVPEERPREVVGLVTDIPLTLPDRTRRPVIYTSYLQQPGRYPLPGANLLGQMTFMVRTSGDPLALMPAVRRAIGSIEPDRPLSNVRTMEDQLRARVPRRGDFLAIIGVFAVAAMLLAAVGIYGIVSYTAARRTREIGVRMALGAGAVDIVHLVGRRAVLLVGVGLLIGVAGALALTRLLQGQLWDVTPTDPVTYAAGSLLLLLVCTVACAVPTRRAASVNPTTVLRCE